MSSISFLETEEKERIVGTVFPCIKKFFKDLSIANVSDEPRVHWPLRRNSRTRECSRRKRLPSGSDPDRKESWKLNLNNSENIQRRSKWSRINK